MCQCIAHVGKLRDSAVQLGNVLERNGFDLGAGAFAVLPQRQKLPNIVDKESEPTRLPNELKRVNLMRPVNTVARCCPSHGWQ
jgi:hypothetical protein